MNIGIFLNCITFISTSYHTKIGTPHKKAPILPEWKYNWWFTLSHNGQPSWFFIPVIHVSYKLVCKLLHKWGSWYFHESKASESAAHKYNNCDKHTNECNKVFIIHYHSSVVSSHTKYQVFTALISSWSQQPQCALTRTDAFKWRVTRYFVREET